MGHRYQRLLQFAAEKEIVLADETTQRVQNKGKTRTAWLWSFIARDEADKELISYVFSRNWSGETPVRVLGDTAGKLVADAYSGYNRVTVPGRRERAGCLAHLRREFFEAQATAPDVAKRAMDFILEVYTIERAALDADLLGTDEHLGMRQTAGKAVMDDFKAWLDAEQPRHPTRSPIAEAIGYALGQWEALTLFLTDPHLPVDNNASERALRVAALGRKNFLFVGHDDAGENLAGLYSLIATCEANQLNPVDYLADVLLRVQSHPASRNRRAAAAQLGAAETRAVDLTAVGGEHEHGRGGGRDRGAAARDSYVKTRLPRRLRTTGTSSASTGSSGTSA